MAAKSLGAVVRAASRNARSFPRTVVDAITDDIRKSVTKSLMADTGGDGSLSHAPGRLRVTRTVKGSEVVEGHVGVNPSGAGRWAWLEGGTDPHAFGEGQHPGTAPKHTWSRAADPAMERADQTIKAAFDRVTEF